MVKKAPERKKEKRAPTQIRRCLRRWGTRRARSGVEVSVSLFELGDELLTAQKVFDPDECDRDKAECDQAPVDFGVAPRFGYTAPLHSQQKRNHSADDEERAEHVHVDQLVLERQVAGVLRVRWRLEDEQDHSCRDTANRKIDIETALRQQPLQLSLS
jgi:hypothetical protein